MSKLEAVTAQFEKALQRLKEVLSLEKNDLVRDSAIQRFEFTLDLSWKMVKAYLEEKKGIVCHSPKECFKEAYRQGLIEYDDYWLKLVDLRNEAAHSYNEETAEKIFAELGQALNHFEALCLSVQKDKT